MQRLLFAIVAICLFSYYTFFFSSKTVLFLPIFNTDEAITSRCHLFWLILFAVVIHVSLYGICPENRSFSSVVRILKTQCYFRFS